MKTKQLTLKECAELCHAQLHGDPQAIVSGVADLQSATSEDVSFLSDSFLSQGRYLSLLPQTKAGLICVPKNTPPIEGKNLLFCDDSSRAFQILAEALLSARRQSGFAGIHPTAVVHETATVGANVTLGPYAVVDAGAVIGDGTTLSAFSFVGAGSQVGAHCFLYPHAIVREHCQLKDRVILQPGAVIGSCGFGYTTTAKGEHHKLEQLGNVILEDDVEIGANTTIDRSRFKTTRIGKGTKIDNLVQIAHNVELGEHNLLAAQTGIAGSTKTGRNVMMGGQVGIVGHLEITDFVMIATRGGVSKSIRQSGKYAGSPVVPLSEHNRSQVHLRNIESLLQQLEALENRVKELEKIRTP